MQHKLIAIVFSITILYLAGCGPTRRLTTHWFQKAMRVEMTSKDGNSFRVLDYDTDGNGVEDLRLWYLIVGIYNEVDDTVTYHVGTNPYRVDWLRLMTTDVLVVDFTEIDYDMDGEVDEIQMWQDGRWITK